MFRDLVGRALWSRIGLSIRSLFDEFESYRADLERRNLELADLLAANAELTSELDRRRLYDKVLAGARRLLQADEAMLWLTEADLTTAQLVAQTDTSHKGKSTQPHITFGAGVEGRVLATRAPLRIHDILAEPDSTFRPYL